MSKFNFNKYKKGIITIEIKSIIPEKFINLLWRNNVSIRNVTRKDITTFCFDTSLSDYSTIKDIAKRTDTKIKIVNRRGIAFFMIKNRKRQTLLGGIILFVGIIYYLSTFLWHINITTEKNITPYEVRSQLKTLGIKPGINKNKVDVYKLEEKIMSENADIMWVRARVEGSRLNISIAERQEPPEVLNDKSPCNVVAKKDGEIIRVYSKAGTSIIKSGDVVKKGDILVKGEQGKEDNIYLVHAEAEVIARTFYEEKKEIPTTVLDREKTGNTDKDIYLDIFGKKIYLKKGKNKFKVHDTILIDKPILKQNVYYEVNEKNRSLDKNEAIDKASNELFSNIIVKLDKSVKIVDKIVDSKQNGDKYEVRVVLVVEENIAELQKIDEVIEYENKNIKEEKKQ
ncbi:sporulation protein YqfD [Clostridium sp. JNZ J1-5]